MSLLDMRTVLFNDAAITFICTIVMTVLWLQNRSHFQGLQYWMAYFAMQFAGVVILMFRGIVPDIVSMTGSNSLIIAGTILLYTGLRMFMKRPVRKVFNRIMLVLFIAAHVYFVQVSPNLEARNILFSVSLIIICSQCGWLLFTEKDRSIRKTASGAGYVSAAFCIVSIIRLFADITSPSVVDFFDSRIHGSFAPRIPDSFHNAHILAHPPSQPAPFPRARA
jgi:hypothetical protein